MPDMRLIVAGAGGRMGRTLIQAIAASKGVLLSAAVDAPGTAAIECVAMMARTATARIPSSAGTCSNPAADAWRVFGVIPPPVSPQTNVLRRPAPFPSLLGCQQDRQPIGWSPEERAAPSPSPGTCWLALAGAGRS